LSFFFVSLEFLAMSYWTKRDAHLASPDLAFGQTKCT